MNFHYNDVIMSAMVSQITSSTIVYSTLYSRRRSKKPSKLSVTGLCGGIHWWHSPHKATVTRKTFPFEDLIMYYINILRKPLTRVSASIDQSKIDYTLTHHLNIFSLKYILQRKTKTTGSLCYRLHYFGRSTFHAILCDHKMGRRNTHTQEQLIQKLQQFDRSPCQLLRTSCMIMPRGTIFPRSSN